MKKSFGKIKRFLRRGMATVLALCTLSSLLVVDAFAETTSTKSIKANNDAMKLSVSMPVAKTANSCGAITSMTTSDCSWFFRSEAFSSGEGAAECKLYQTEYDGTTKTYSSDKTLSETFFIGSKHDGFAVNTYSGNLLYNDKCYFTPSMQKNSDNSYVLHNDSSSDKNIRRNHNEIGWLVVPLAVSVTVPAKSTAEVTYGFDVYEEQLFGACSGTVLNADCNKAADSTVAVPSGAMLTQSDTIHTLENSSIDAVAGCVVDPASFWLGESVDSYAFNGDFHAYNIVTAYELEDGVTIPENLYGSLTPSLIEKLTGKNSGCIPSYNSSYGEKTFTFINNDDTEKTFTRYFVYYKFHNAFWGSCMMLSHDRTDPIHEGKGTTTISVADYKVSPISGEQTVTQTNIRVVRPDAQSEEPVTDSSIIWSDVEDFQSDVIKKIRDASDQDYHTAQGWYRLQMSPLTENGEFSYGSGQTPTLYSADGQEMSTDDSYQYVIADNKTPTVSAKVSDAYPTQSISSYGHPLPNILKYAWLSNGTYSTNGAVGYDYVKPEGEIKLKSNVYDNDVTAGTSSADDYDCWLIKYAGKKGYSETFYLALEGTDGLRRLLVNVPALVSGGIEVFQTVLVTAAEYDTHPELYQTYYGWPTSKTNSKAYTQMTDADALLHEDCGLWEKGTNRLKLLDETLDSEAFTMKLSGNLQWSVGDSTTVNGKECYQSFLNKPTVDIDSLKDGTLYQYYMSNKEGNTNAWKQLEKWDQTVTNLLAAMTDQDSYAYNAVCEVGITYRGDALFEESTIGGNMVLDADEFVFSLMDYGFGQQEYEGFTFRMKLGTYATVIDSTDLYVGEGQTLVIGSDVTLQSNQTLNIAKGGTMEVRGILTNMGTINCYGTIQVESGGCIKSNSATQDGKYNFVGGTLVVGTNGVFYPENKNGADQINFKSSSVYNDGLFVASTGFTLTDSRFENNVNGVVFIAGGLRKSIEVNGVRTIAESIQRGMPEYEEIWKPLHDSYVMYPEMPYSRLVSTAKEKNPTLSGASLISAAMQLERDSLTNMNKLYLYGTSYYCNNGVTYNWGGIKVSGANVAIFGAHEFIHYLDITKSTDSYRVEHQFASGFISGWYADEWVQYNSGTKKWSKLLTNKADGSDKSAMYNYNGGVDQIDSAIWATFGADCLTLDSALSHITGYTAAEWNDAFNEADNYTPPAVLKTVSYSGGC